MRAFLKPAQIVKKAGKMLAFFIMESDYLCQGTRKIKDVFSPGTDVTSMPMLWRSAIRFAIARPRQVPAVFI